MHECVGTIFCKLRQEWTYRVCLKAYCNEVTLLSGLRHCLHGQSFN